MKILHSIRLLFWNLVAIVLFVAATAYTALLWMDSYTRHGETVTVPNVKGLPMEQAMNELGKQLLKSQVIDSTYVRGMPAGAVLEQIPEGASKVKEGRMVYLTINTGTIPTLIIPDLIDNSSFRQAEAKLRSMGFKLNAPEMVPGERDWVYGIKHNGRLLHSGDNIARDSYLTLCIGNGGVEADDLKPDTVVTVEPIQNTPTVVDDNWF
ncbi:MAG: PASTA domain-containing protein [Bacteroidales bacterium]|nr:PASTA domain-containing protein [Bacteroidales bacterium]